MTASSRLKARDVCYACERKATTREHVPPVCFFPLAYRSNLITVPSCPKHNNANSLDVEYVRSVLIAATDLGPNSKPVFEKMIRSIDRRPALAASIFRDLQPIEIRGHETGAFTVDLRRFGRVMSAIAQAIHYRDFNQKRRYWEIFCPSFYLPESVVSQQDAFDPLRRTAATFKYTYETAQSPSVFCYGRTRRSPKGCIYQFIFYGVVIVYAWPAEHQFR